MTPLHGPLDDEDGPALWVRIALLAAIPAFIASEIALRAGMRQFIDRADELFDASGRSAPHVPMFNHGLNVALQLLGGVTTLTGILFLVWFARSAHNANALGLAPRREPAAAVAGFIVPIINLWWPYQSVCDIAPDDTATRRLVLRWFLLWVVGGFVGSVVTIASAFVDSPAGWALLAVPAALVTLAGLSARQVVTTVVDFHHTLS